MGGGRLHAASAIDAATLAAATPRHAAAAAAAPREHVRPLCVLRLGTGGDCHPLGLEASGYDKRLPRALTALHE